MSVAYRQIDIALINVAVDDKKNASEITAPRRTASVVVVCRRRHRRVPLYTPNTIEVGQTSSSSVNFVRTSTGRHGTRDVDHLQVVCGAQLSNILVGRYHDRHRIYQHCGRKLPEDERGGRPATFFS